MTEPKFVEFKTKDELLLPGLLYEAKNSKKVAIYLHGNGSSSVFYDEFEKRPLANALNKAGISLFRFNNRGAHLIKKLNIRKNGREERKSYGCAFEKIKECVLDIDAAVKFLKEKGYKEFYLIGSSTGANKICVFDHYAPKNEIKKYVLLSGGDDTNIYYDILGKKKFYKLLEKSGEKIKKRKGEEIITELLPLDEVFSYKAFYDIANHDGDYNTFPFYEVINKVKLSKKPLFRYFKSIKKPTFIIYGELDEYAWGDAKRVVSILKSYKPEFTYEVVKGADHGFTGHEKELASVVSSWLGK